MKDPRINLQPMEIACRENPQLLRCKSIRLKDKAEQCIEVRGRDVLLSIESKVVTRWDARLACPACRGAIYASAQEFQMATGCRCSDCGRSYTIACTRD